MTSTLEALNELKDHVESMRLGMEKVKPGQDLAFTMASTVGDRIAQGDFNITVVGFSDEGYTPPEDYTLKTGVKQLVHGNTVGAKHVVRDLTSCNCYFPSQWDSESLKGPVVVAKSETSFDHPKHGNVSVPAGMCVEITYSRELDMITRQERRAAD